jgi:hypothetical protein
MADWHILLGELVAFHFVGNTVIFFVTVDRKCEILNNREKEENIAFLFTA